MHFTLSLHWYDFLRDNKDVLSDYMWHADEAETSVGLYLYPQYVDMSKAEKGGGEALVDRKWIIAPGMAPRPGTMYHFEGTFARPEAPSCPTASSATRPKRLWKKAKKVVTRTVDYVTELIQDIMTRWPVGVKPPIKLVWYCRLRGLGTRRARC